MVNQVQPMFIGDPWWAIPCQGVSGLNADRKGALRDERSALHVHVGRMRDLIRQFFPWCPVYTLMESVASMDRQDRDVMSAAYGSEPFVCDASSLCWCHRPRLDWEMVPDEHTQITFDKKLQITRLEFKGCQPLSQVLRAGWTKVDASRAFPTFTASRPSSRVGNLQVYKRECSTETLRRWSNDMHRFPPYQYAPQHCVQRASGEMRVVDVSEREALMGFPQGCTSACLPKAQRKGPAYNDCRRLSWATRGACQSLRVFWSNCCLNAFHH